MENAKYKVTSLLLVFCAALLLYVFDSWNGKIAKSNSEAALLFPTTLSFTKVAVGFTLPTAITNAADGSGRLFIAEKPGQVRIIQNSTVLATPFLNISSLVNASGAEQGLLGLAFPPAFATRRTFYVNYTNRVGVGDTVVARLALSNDPNAADPASFQQLLTITQPFVNHNGGQLAFGPDSFLYIGTGDGGSAGDPLGNGQNPASLLGKLLRLDVLSNPAVPYTIPAENPFNNEIWALGLRNPWRFSFDRLTKDLFIADVGQDLVEEIDFQPAGSGRGANYGWNVMEGSSCFKPGCNSSGLTPPVAEYGHGSGDCSVTGGYVYRGSTPALQGLYIYGDFCSGRIWGLRWNGSTWENQLLADTDFSISTFGEDEVGELYLADYTTGDIYRIGSP